MLRCFFKEPRRLKKFSLPASGILGAVAGTIGSIQATEAIKFLAVRRGVTHDRILTYDAKSMSFHNVAVRRDPGCAACGSPRQPAPARPRARRAQDPGHSRCALSKDFDAGNADRISPMGSARALEESTSFMANLKPGGNRPAVR